VAVFGVLGFQCTKQKFGCFLGFRFENRTQNGVQGTQENLPSPWKCDISKSQMALLSDIKSIHCTW